MNCKTVLTIAIICLTCTGLPHLEARALRSATAAGSHAEDAAQSFISGLTMAARALQGAGPVNKAQIERIEENLKAGVLPDWQQSQSAAGRKLSGAGPVNKAQIERIEENLKAGVMPDWQQLQPQAGRNI